MTANCQFLHKVHSARKHQCQGYYYIVCSVSKYCNFILLSASVNMCLPKTNHRWIEEWIQNLHQVCTSQRCVLEVTSSVHLHFPLRYSVNNKLRTYVIHSSVIVQQNKENLITSLLQHRDQLLLSMYPKPGSQLGSFLMINNTGFHANTVTHT